MSLDEYMVGVIPQLCMEENAVLNAPFTKKEVLEEISQMKPNKAPGPDGMSVVFYKKFWELVGMKVQEEVLGVLNGNPMPKSWNETTIVLIPKKNNLERITEFRPISLCNVLYKMISKVLANGLKEMLPEIISPTQSAFVPGRLITDNVLIAYESLHAIKQKRKGKEGWCAVKLDMHKAYDRAEWIFLRSMMEKLGFHEQWIDMVMACVSSVRYKIRFNSQETDMFVPSRGIRQGDPLSPYLFLICAEGLSSMLQFEEEVGSLDGVRVCRNAPSVSHLLFADDSLILMGADVLNATSLQHVLDTYCQSSGQMVSLSKSSIFFSPNTPVVTRTEVCEILHIVTEALSDRYLGLPAIVGADRSDCFKHFRERIKARLIGWMEKQLSTGGKEILLKAVAQAIPVFGMSVFCLPKGVCKDITNVIAQFWWGDDEENRKMHWYSWWKLCFPKSEGGMGFRDLYSFNLAMLAKQCWRLITDPDSLCARVLKAKYYPNGSLLQATPK